MNQENDQTNKKAKDVCLICGSPIKMRCKCMRQDTTCVNGHSYHFDTNTGECHEGMSDHGSDICCQEKKIINTVKEETTMETKLNVKLLTHTPDPEKLIASAAKLCYSKSDIQTLMDNLTHQSIEDFLNKLTKMGHESPLEHISFSFGIEGVSRSLTHQLVRHRIASYSQQSQRYVKLNQFQYVIPPAIAENRLAKEIYINHMIKSQEAYDSIVRTLIDKMIVDDCIKNSYIYPRSIDWIDMYKNDHKKVYLTFEKKAIEDARYVFPNACETKIILTMNARSMINFFHHRCCERAQWEIRELAIQMLKLVREVCPNIFANIGPSCLKGKCPEGNMTCGKMLEIKEKFSNL